MGSTILRDARALPPAVLEWIFLDTMLMAENDNCPLYGARIEWPSAATVVYRSILYLLVVLAVMYGVVAFPF